MDFTFIKGKRLAQKEHETLYAPKFLNVMGVIIKSIINNIDSDLSSNESRTLILIQMGKTNRYSYITASQGSEKSIKK